MDLTGPPPLPCRFTVTVFSSQFGSFPHRQLGQHSSILSKWYSNFYLCLNTSASARPRTRQNEKGYTQSVAGHTGYWTRLRTASTPYNERGGCASKNMTWHEPFRLFFYSYFAAISAAFVFALFCPPPLHHLSFSSLAFFFLGCVQTYFFPYSSAL